MANDVLRHWRGRDPRVRAAQETRARPSGAHGEQAREQLLDIALELFARQGIGETTLGAIAREAGVTPAMVHYYFKTRDQLLDMLIDERFVPLRAELARVFNDPDSEPVDTLARFRGDARRDGRQISVVRGALGARDDQRRRTAASAHGGALRRRAQGPRRSSASRGWQKEGKLNPSLEPSLVFASLFGLTVFPLATSRWRGEGNRTLSAEQLARHVVALLMNGIRPY